MSKKINTGVLVIVTIILIIFGGIVYQALQNRSKGETVSSHGVNVSDYTKLKIDANDEGDIVFGKNNNYEIAHLKTDDQFIISILSSPFEEVRLKAEQELLSKLKISEIEACKLNVVITTPRFANPDQAGQAYNLSFCN